jgi:GDPmannose 4,6-dehydratase
MAVACIVSKTTIPPLDESGAPLVQDGKLRMGNLDAVRDWGYAPDYVDAMWAMLQQDEPDSYVIATNTSYTIRDLCAVAFSRAGLNWEDHVVTDEAFMRPTEIAASKGDYAKAKATLGWEPKKLFAEIIEEMVDADVARLTE